MNRKGQRLDLRPGCLRIMAASWAHRRSLVATLHSQVWRWEKWGTLGRQVGRWGEFGVSGFLGRLNGPPSVQVLSADHLHTPCHPRPTPCQPLSTPCVPALSTGTRPAKPLGITGCPRGHWTQQPPPVPPAGPAGPPRGGVLEPRRVCVSHSHFWTKIVTPSSPLPTPSSPLSTPSSFQVHPPSPHLPSTTHTWLIEVNRGCAKVSIGCLAVGLYVSASAVQKTIGDHR